MNAVKPVTIEISGVERTLRFTLGARRRIHDAFGMDFKDALNKYDSAAFPEILHALMFDEKGKAPDISAAELAELLPTGDSPEIMGVIISAATNGRVEKNEAEALVKAAMQTEGSTTSNSSQSPISASESKTEPSSTGGSLNANSSHSSTATQSENESSTTAPV